MTDDRIEIVEVSPRDGLQNEALILSTATKLELVRRAGTAGLRRIEATSFVNPKRVPQMSDADAVATGLGRGGGLRYIGLALNSRGYARAVAAGMDEVTFVVVASETFNRRNQGVGTFESVAALGELSGTETPAVPVGVAVAAAFGCPFEGDVPVARLMEVVEACMAHRPSELTLADTIGVATPRDIKERVGAVRRAFPAVPLRLHLHDTRNTGVANAWAAFEAGVRSLDASLAGVGGCPFAPNATGNVATEDLVYMFERSGVRTGVDLDAAIETARWLDKQIGHPAPGRLMRAGGFPN